MEIIKDFNNIKIRRKQAAAIGVFDGFHAGHQKIAKKTLETALKYKLEPMVITFEPVFGKRSLLTTLAERLALFKKTGFKRAMVLRKNDDWTHWTPEEFIEAFLLEKLNAGSLIVGEDFKFGKNRVGDIKTLSRYHNEDFKLVTVSLKKINGIKVSSSGIRRLVKAGDMERAAGQLGRNYFFTGEKIQGEGIGRKIGFPTINFKVADEKLLPQGVFLTDAMCKGSRKGIRGACFIGYAKNVKLKKSIFKVELHLLDYKQGMEKNIFGAEIITKIRNPEKFKSLDELREKIKQDISRMKRL